ncbi:MAG: hypothetical protein WC900_03765 [Oscillospiraceae bacterium]
MKSEHRKKILSAVACAVCVFLYYAIFGVIIISVGFSELEPWVMFVGALIPLVVGGLLLSVTASRIDEIKGGQEDDLSKY